MPRRRRYGSDEAGGCSVDPALLAEQSTEKAVPPNVAATYPSPRAINAVELSNRIIPRAWGKGFFSSLLEEFRSSCDLLCIHQQHGSESRCLAQASMKWNAASCALSGVVEENKQEQHLEKGKDRCLKEFKAGITAPP